LSGSDQDPTHAKSDLQHMGDCIFTTASSALVLNGIQIDICDSVKFLGMMVDNKLRFEEYVNQTVKKASQQGHNQNFPVP